MLKFLGFILCLAGMQPAFAAVNCYTGIQRVMVDSAGFLQIYTTTTTMDGYLAICNVKADFKGVAPQVCTSWTALALSARLAQAKVTIRYNDPISACDSSQIGFAQASAAPAYFMVEAP